MAARSTTARRLSIVVGLMAGLLISGCGLRSSDSATGPAAVADATADEAGAGSTATGDAPATTPDDGSDRATDPGGEANDPPDATDPAGEAISPEELEDLERTLDEIDQILADLEADLAED
jgi:hypothetical protein